MRTGNKDIHFLMNSISLPNTALLFSYLLPASAFCFQNLTHLIFLTSQELALNITGYDSSAVHKNLRNLYSKYTKILNSEYMEF